MLTRWRADFGIFALIVVLAVLSVRGERVAVGALACEASL